MTQTQAPPRAKITPELQAIFEAIRFMDEHKEAPPTPGDAGRYKNQLDCLIEAINDGLDTYQQERTRFFRDDDNAFKLFATYGTPEPEQEKEDERFTPGKDGKRIIKLASIEDIYALPDKKYLISKILESVGVSMMVAMSGTGKTFTALNMGLSIAHGLYWMGLRVEQGPVWYVNTEGGRSLKNRIKAWYALETHNKLFPSHTFKIIPWSLDLRENFHDLIDTIDAMSSEEKPSFIILDNWSMCTAGVNQNLQEEVMPILKALNDLSQNNGFHVMIIHHTNKEDDFNGTMAFRNHVDTMVQLKKEDKQDKHSPILFTSLKPRDDEPFGDIKTELKQIELYTNPDTLESITSCVLVQSETPIKQVGLNPTEQNVLDTLGDRSLIYTEWQKECTSVLKFTNPTFERYRKKLEVKGYVEKYKPEGQNIDHYRKAVSSEDTLAKGNGVDSSD